MPFTSICQIVLELFVQCDWELRSYLLVFSLALGLNCMEFSFSELLDYEIEINGAILSILISDTFGGM